MQLSTEFLKNEIKRSGLRPSYQRIKVLEYLHLKHAYPSVDEVYAGLSPEIPILSKATIYNTLHLFVDVGLARVVSIDGVEMRYDIALHNHGHFKCDHCGSITDFAFDLDDFPIDELRRFHIRSKNVHLAGLCPNCLNQKKGKGREV